jgi:dTDP-4-dehydrorhamnose reductase
MPKASYFARTWVETSGVRQMDVRDSEAVMRTVGEIPPSLVLHLAAETDLERCERELPHAYQTNVIGTLNVVLAAKKYNVDLVYISTAGLFDGTQAAALPRSCRLDVWRKGSR